MKSGFRDSCGRATSDLELFLERIDAPTLRETKTLIDRTIHKHNNIIGFVEDKMTNLSTGEDETCLMLFIKAEKRKRH